MTSTLTVIISIVLFLAVAWLVSEWLMRVRIRRIDEDEGETS